MKLTVVNQNANFWDAVSDTAYPALLRYGYTLFLKDGTTDEYLRIIYANGQPQSNSEIGYTFVQEIPPNAGFSNTGNTIDWIRGNAGLQLIADTYSIPNPISFDEMKSIDFGLILESDLRVTEKDGVFTDWAVQPYESEPLKYNTGEILYDVNGDKLYPLKEF